MLGLDNYKASSYTVTLSSLNLISHRKFEILDIYKASSYTFTLPSLNLISHRKFETYDVRKIMFADEKNLTWTGLQ